MIDPISLFREWHRQASSLSTAGHPNAMCVSTVDGEGIPHARFVDLKAVRSDGFVFCTSYTSPKSIQIQAQAIVSLTFWWDHVGRQVRVIGHATRISDDEADIFFADRGRDAQIASWACDQSQHLGESESLADRITSARARFGEAQIPRPPHWGGYLVAPRRIEFLTFREDRMHERVVYESHESLWIMSTLQP